MKSTRFTALTAAALRKFAFLLTFFADQLSLYGWRQAASASAELVWPHLRKRLGKLGDLTRGGRERPPPALRNGVLFVGYAEGALGLGQAFRADLKAAEAAGLPFAIYPFRSGIQTRMTGPYMPQRYDTRHAYAINLIEVAADQLPEVIRIVPERTLKHSYNILRTYWELPQAPEAWRTHLQGIHEIWAPNNFVAEAFAHIFDGPITIVPPVVEDAALTEGLNDRATDRARFGMEADRFYFLFTFDYYSSPFRKNPLGILQAFRAAFPVGDEKVGLILKSTGAPDHFPHIKAEIAQAMELDSRIKMLDQNMARLEILALIRASDAYLSLHRSEGFGLGMVEAMTLERTVVGTDYSGSTDFLNSSTGYPIPYTLRPVMPHEYPWSAGQSWAEPDLETASRVMREVAGHPEDLAERARHARAYVLNRYDAEAVGKAMAVRLKTLQRIDLRRGPAGST